MSLHEVLTAGAVVDLAGPGAYGRGVGYHADGRVELGPASDDAVSAVVRGSMPYRVELSSEGGAISWQCDCPAAADGAFCKHCVAVALAIAGDIGDGPSGFLRLVPSPAEPTAEPTSGEGDLADYVAGLDHDRLVELVMDQADGDWRLKERLVAESQAAAGLGPSEQVWRKRIDRAFGSSGDFVSYHEAPGWAADIGELIDALVQLCDAGHADATVGLAGHAHRRADAAIQHVDDSDGWLSDISSRLGELHLRACRASRPDPVGLARSLVDLELTSELPGFHRAAAVYADVLGDKGLAEYRRLLKPGWAELLSHAGDESRRYGQDFAVRQAMIGWAIGTGDPDTLIEVKAQDLRLPDDHLEIAGMLSNAGRLDEAREWAQRGLTEHADRTGQLSPLRDFLAGLLRADGDNDGSIELFWEAFTAAPSLSTYRRLLDEAPDRREEWAARCLETLRSRAADQADDVPLWPAGPSSVLIEILAFEGQTDAAWAVANQHGCDRRMMMTLARAREAAHPLDAISVYEPEVFELIDQKNKRGYRAAVDLMAHIEELAEHSGTPERFDTVLRRARTEHRAKRNLKAMLDAKGWPDPT